MDLQLTFSLTSRVLQFCRHFLEKTLQITWHVYVRLEGKKWLPPWPHEIWLNTKLYECPRVFNIWELISTLLKVKITYKHIVIGNLEDNSFIYNRNLLITYISYSIYKFWVLSQNNLSDFKNDCLLSFIKKDLFMRTIYNQDENFKKQCDSLIKKM